MHYRGVSYHPRDHIYLARVKYRKNWVWLTTFHNAIEAAQVRDCAARWVLGPDAKLNFHEHQLPPGITEAHIAKLLVNSRIPLDFLARRIPLDILRKAGVTAYDLTQAGVAIRDAMALG
jgi:hypothetical protein